MDATSGDLEALGLLSEPQRARLYEFLAANGPCTRQEVCEALGMGRTLVAFHLLKLEQARLVTTVDEPAGTGRRGRPAQRYRAARRELNASVPPRRYELLAEILLRAAREHLPSESFTEAAVRAAVRLGRGLAAEQAASGAPDALWDLLGRLGYEPAADGGSVLLTNCPFQRMRAVDTELVCSVNAALARGCLDGLNASERFTARLRPCPDNCCVLLEPAA
ncbi:helix-turn-helix domain-containing protein [Planomonospora sp. ID91781]|uniref:Transcriptional regulator n=1 Tax=Planomonospora sphaerica TaxID=161355 RepID=A0A161LQ54_9ACTN|nr:MULTISPECIES: helix-turn-helix domain-containing protein [Planomonospora]MBG0819686.1 helix-turn-helix domain-containing protein [Planomonospora sp. ID91781]GAT70415.1 transcriptional regulator [Planomonospora sphaerica]